MFAKTILALLPLMGTAMAHLQLQDPIPLDSTQGGKRQPVNVQSYSYTAPLTLDGAEWPCKGPAYYQNSALLAPVATWAAGSKQSFTVAPPGAAHGGGSCQLSLSYDGGATWNVIYSIIGGCMAEGSSYTYSFDLPSEAPSGNVLFAWGWFNRIGNREMYHNCASVTITGGGSGLNANDYPAPFVANAGVNQCSTQAGQDVVFPNPGKNVLYQGSYADTTPQPGLGVIGDNCVAPGGAGSPTGTGSGSGAAISSSSAPSAPASSASSTSGGVGVGIDVGTGGATISASIGHVLAPIATPSASTSTASAGTPSTTSQPQCKRRRRRRSNVMRRSHFANSAGHAARRVHG